MKHSDGDTAYSPFGYGYAQSGSAALSFTGENQDTATNLYDFMYREYGIQGRWTSPDPLGPGAFNLADPQSLDRYAYVRNSPMSLVDPLGLKCTYDSQGNITGDDGTLPLCETSPSVTVTAEPDCYMPEMGGTGSWEQVICQLVLMGGRDTYYGGFEGSMSDGWLGGRSGAGSSSSGSAQTRKGCVQTVFDPSCQPKGPPSCPAVFLKATGEAAANDVVFPPGESPEDLIRAGGSAWAATYIVEKGLVVPMRSSVVRNILGDAEFFAEMAVFVPVIYAESQGLKQEVSAWRSGTCSTIWTKP